MKHDNRHTIIGGKHRALSRYYMILHRLNHTDDEKNKCYKGVKMLIDKDTFVEWFMKHDFEGASVDRIDSSKDYSLDNIQMIPVSENIRKDKVKAKNGMCECYVCKTVKPLELFAKSNRRKNGHSTICKACDAKRTSSSVRRKKGEIN